MLHASSQPHASSRVPDACFRLGDRGSPRHGPGAHRGSGGGRQPRSRTSSPEAEVITRRCWTGALSFVALILPADASAQDLVDPLGGHARKAESPQNFAAEIRVAPFWPDIDSDPALHGATPYKQVFGTTPLILVSAELDWQAYRIPYFGTVGPGLGVGFATKSDPALFQQEHDGTYTSQENTSITIFPFYGAVVLRADALWRMARVPIVPYAKVGLGLALWRASNTLGTSRSGGVVGEGHSFGTHVALGLALNLNPFDSYASSAFDDAMGVNNTYLFFEWSREDLDGLGVQSNPLRVGGTALNFGLAFEF
jgi:hypothetical protein